MINNRIIFSKALISLWRSKPSAGWEVLLPFSFTFFFYGDTYLSPQQPKALTSENNECIKKQALSLSSFLSPSSRWPCLQVASKCFWERLLRLRIRWLWVIGSCYETLVTTPLSFLGSHNNSNNDGDDDDDNEDVDDDDDDLHVIQSN